MDNMSAPPVLQVKVTRRETVLPATPTPRHSFFLTCLDILWQDVHYNRRLLFYKSPTAASHDDDALQSRPLHRCSSDGDGRMQQLKRSLALCLVQYYCWCGRIAKGLQPPHRLFIDCNDAGVEFVEATMDMPLSLLARDGFQMKPFFDELCQSPDHKGDSLFSSPLLSIQATLFSDGGLAVGVAQSHVVADGQSLWDFMISWAECSKGVTLSQFPVHDRHMLAVPNPSLERATGLRIKIDDDDDEEEEDKATSRTEDKGRDVHNDPTISRDNDEANVGQQPNSTLSKDKDSNGCIEDGNGVGEDEANSLVQCMFHLSSSAIKKLKQEAGGSYTSFEVTCAHFWQRTTNARKTSPREPTNFFIPVNCRSRMRPPLSPAYFGNVIGACIVSTRVGKVVKGHLSSIASFIHNKIVEVNEDHVVGMMHWLEHNNNRFESARSNIPQGKGHNVASSPRFPAYLVDFGWGKPVAIRAVKVTGDGEMVFFGGNPRATNQGDIEICIALPNIVLRRLLDDPMFLPKVPSSPFAIS